MQLVDEALLDEFRAAGRCEFCGTWHERRDPHHIFTRGAGRVDHRWNLIALCPGIRGHQCHVRAQDGKIPRVCLMALVAIREGMFLEPVDAMEAEIHRIRRLPKGSTL